MVGFRSAGHICKDYDQKVIGLSNVEMYAQILTSKNEVVEVSLKDYNGFLFGVIPVGIALRKYVTGSAKTTSFKFHIINFS